MVMQLGHAKRAVDEFSGRGHYEGREGVFNGCDAVQLLLQLGGIVIGDHENGSLRTALGRPCQPALIGRSGTADHRDRSAADSLALLFRYRMRFAWRS
ncbi:MAG: hypothetical protein JW395_0972 [Nitrospira sp.]|nr:hypothetical protein [Nitrospira sp.]